MKYRHHIVVSGRHPGVQKRIPMHRIFGSEAMKKGIGIGEDLWVKQMIEGQRPVRLARGGGWFSMQGHSGSLSAGCGSFWFCTACCAVPTACFLVGWCMRLLFDL